MLTTGLDSCLREAVVISGDLERVRCRLALSRLAEHVERGGSSELTRSCRSLNSKAGKQPIKIESFAAFRSQTMQ